MARKQKKRLPKQLAGVKVPKSVRKGQLGKAIASPDGRAVLAELLMAAATVAGAKKAKDSGAPLDALTEVAHRLREAGSVKGGGKAMADGTVTYAIGEAARTFVKAYDRRRAGEAKEAAASGAEGLTQAPGAAETKRKPSSYEEVQH
jgi:hypothetical protein